MVPYPEEIDVFSAPHSRMKALVDVYSEKLRCTDLSDCFALDSLLQELHSTFCEFKSHEQIENKYIMRKLKNRLKVLEMDAAVCNCHSDNQLSDMLALVEAGRCCIREEERREFGRRLRRALHQFTTSFLPHMKEEEEVFQPMLMKYFEYEELKCLKERVIEEHSKWSEKNALEEAQADRKVDCSSSSSWNCRELPSEVLRHILSFLPRRELIACSSVSRQWHSASRDPSLWREIHPVFWAHGIWSDYCEDSHEERVSLFYPGEEGRRNLRDEDAEEEDSPHQGEALLLDGVVRELLPHVGTGVHKIVISSSRALDSITLRSILMLCPNVAHLDVSYTAILDSTFKGVRLLHLRHLNLSGCSRVTDEGLFRVADAMAPSEEEIEESGLKSCRECVWQGDEAMCRLSQCCRPSLKHLNLSGCKDITDEGLGCLLAAGVLRNLLFLDVSGCWLLSGEGLRSLPSSLPPENISYCDRITDGPHPHEANGCQNLETGRACCRNGI